MIPLTSGASRMELLKIELLTGRVPARSPLAWDEFLHLYALLRQLPSATDQVRSEVLRKLLARGFEHRAATVLMGLASAGVQPLSMLVRQAAVHAVTGNATKGKGSKDGD